MGSQPLEPTLEANPIAWVPDGRDDGETRRARGRAAVPGTPLGMRLLVVAVAITYTGLIQWSYSTIVAPLFTYYGTSYNPALDGSLELALVLCVIPSFWLPVAVSRPSQVLIWLLYFLAYIPSLLVPLYVLGTGFGGVFPLSFAVVVSFGLLSLMQLLPRPAISSKLRITHRNFEHGVLAIAVGLGIYIALAFGISFDIPDPSSVYDVRSAFKEALGASSLPLVPYAVAWSGNVVNPLLMLLGLRSRRLLLFASGAVIELMVYNTTGFKSALYAIVLLVPLLILLRPRWRQSFGLGASVLTTALIPIALLWDWLSGSLFATDLVLHRLIMLPGQLVGDYYQYFSDNPTYGLRHSILGFLGPPPYDLGPPNVIGDVYFGNPITSANANLWGDAFANFGLVGLPVFTLGLGLFLVFLDGVSTGRDLRITGTLAGLMAVQLCNSGLLTTIANLGLGLATVLILFMPQEVTTPVIDPVRSAMSKRPRIGSSEPSMMRRATPGGT
jgi:O-antigen polymerase